MPQPTISQDDLTARQAVNTPGSSVAKKPRLLDFCIIDDDNTARSSVDDITTELQTFFDQPRLDLDIDPVKYWTQHNETSLSKFALQLFSVPCSSAPVECPFSKAGVVLSQQQSQIGSE